MVAPHDKFEERVLIADDDQSIRQLLGTIIHREGLAVDLAADGEEAVEFLEQREYPVILLDMMMPKMDGFQVVEWLKEHPPAQKPVVVIITAYADQKFKDVDAELVSGILRKPFDVTDVGSLVRECINSFKSILQGGMLSSDETVRTLSPDAMSHLQALRDEGATDGRKDH